MKHALLHFFLLLAQQVTLSFVAATNSCPPSCPDVSYFAQLKVELDRELGLAIERPSPELVARQQDRPADDKHFYKPQALAQLARYRVSGIAAADVAAAMGVSRATKCEPAGACSLQHALDCCR